MTDMTYLHLHSSDKILELWNLRGLQTLPEVQTTVNNLAYLRTFQPCITVWRRKTWRTSHTSPSSSDWSSSSLLFGHNILCPHVSYWLRSQHRFCWGSMFILVQICFQYVEHHAGLIIMDAPLRSCVSFLSLKQSSEEVNTFCCLIELRYNTFSPSF